MSKPSDIELKIALQIAVEMKQHNSDDSFLAKCLLNHNYRLKYLEEVLKLADKYMNYGMNEQDHMHLLRAIEKAKEADDYTAHQYHQSFGLE